MSQMLCDAHVHFFSSHFFVTLAGMFFARGIGLVINNASISLRHLIFSTISVIEDRNQGFLQGVLVSPLSRGGIVLGQALGGTTLAVLQGVLFLALAPLVA